MSFTTLKNLMHKDEVENAITGNALVFIGFNSKAKTTQKQHDSMGCLGVDNSYDFDNFISCARVQPRRT